MPSRFRHGVASGDPLTDSVVIWTRVSGADADLPVGWVLARDPEFGDVVASGDAEARAAADHTVQIDVSGLDPGSDYHYRFELDDERSPAGRTRTLPAFDAERTRFAICSCAKFNAGFFNAYARIAERDDLDFVLHLGDYIYEASNTPPKSQTPGADIGRPFDPLDECRSLGDYRTRYAQYRSDPDVQAMHRALPLIATLDDHELADGAWAGGADNHRPEEHGPWEERRAAALQARWEWLPARRPDRSDPTRVFRSLDVGGLAEIFLLDIRSRRDRPVVGPEMSEPTRSMLGAEQRDWLFSALDRSEAGWRLLATPSILNTTWIEHPSELLKTALLKLKLMDEDGAGPDEDQWDGYPAERADLLAKLRDLDDVVVLSGDIHVSAAAEVRDSTGPVVAELTTTSLTSQNLDEKLGVVQRSEEVQACEREFLDRLDHFSWVEMASHGYAVIDVDRDRVRADWHLVEGVLERLPGESLAASFEVRRGSRSPSRVAETKRRKG